MSSSIKVIHLGQLDILPFGIKPNPEVAKAIAESQIKVANFIRKHPNILVFLGDLNESHTGIPSDELTWPVNQILFRDGLPDDASKLNELQQKYLSETEGSVRTLHRLGILNTMYRTISPELSQVKDSRQREIAAMESIKEVLQTNPDAREVILVFGSGHDFSEHCKNYGYEHEKFDFKEFDFKTEIMSTGTFESIINKIINKNYEHEKFDFKTEIMSTGTQEVLQKNPDAQEDISLDQPGLD